MAAGVLGLLALGGYVLARRLGPMHGSAWSVAPAPLALVTVSVFGLAGALLTVPPLMPMLFGETAGTGANLTGGIVALTLAAVAAGMALLRRRVTSDGRAGPLMRWVR